jgi:hypothetical protein
MMLRSAALVLALVAAVPARATLVDCKPAESAPYVVFLSEPENWNTAFRNRVAMLTVFNELHRHLDQRRDLEMAELRHVKFRVARCEARVPRIDGSEFTDNVVSSLHNQSVVVEIWGELGLLAGGRPRAQMNYLLVPVKRGHIAGSRDVPGIHRFDYPDRDIAATGFVDLISNADLHTFVAAAIGISAFDGEDYPLAHEMLCMARARLARTEGLFAVRPQTSAQAADIRRLREFVADLAGRAIVDARKRPPPTPLFAVLHDPANPCSSQ